MIHLILNISKINLLVSGSTIISFFLICSIYKYYILLYSFTKSKIFDTDILASICTLHIIGKSYCRIIKVSFYRSTNRVITLSPVIKFHNDISYEEVLYRLYTLFPY